MANKVVTFGEILLRLTTPGNERFLQARNFNATYGGCEANVAVSLCNYGMEAAFVSKVPDNPIGESAINHLRQFGVDTRYVNRGGNRLGIYFLEAGASVRPSRVIYDRAGSSIAIADDTDFDFEEILEDAAWFHTTGITPALSDNAAKLTLKALHLAQKKGITTSLDLNYRQKLWDKSKAQEVIMALAENVDVMIDAGLGGSNEPETFFGIRKKQIHNPSEEDIVEIHKQVFHEMMAMFDFKYIATTVRENISASDNDLSALIMDKNGFYQTKRYRVHIVDRVGGGDAFSSGLIYGIMSGMETSESAEFAMAASALKHSIPGDQNLSTVEEVMTLMKGDGAGRVVR